MYQHNLIRCLALSFLIQSPVGADEAVIGYVKTMTPQAFWVKNDKTEPIVVGQPVYEGTVLKTDSTGSLGITLKDNTILSFGPDTEFEVTGYLYAPGDDQLKLDMNLLKGTLHYISGVIAKLKPSAVHLKTPAGIIGVRGTRFVVKVDE